MKIDKFTWRSIRSECILIEMKLGTSSIDASSNESPTAGGRKVLELDNGGLDEDAPAEAELAVTIAAAIEELVNLNDIEDVSDDEAVDDSSISLEDDDLEPLLPSDELALTLFAASSAMPIRLDGEVLLPEPSPSRPSSTPTRPAPPSVNPCPPIPAVTIRSGPLPMLPLLPGLPLHRDFTPAPTITLMKPDDTAFGDAAAEQHSPSLRTAQLTQRRPRRQIDGNTTSAERQEQPLASPAPVETRACETTQARAPMSGPPEEAHAREAALETMPPCESTSGAPEDSYARETPPLRSSSRRGLVIGVAAGLTVSAFVAAATFALGVVRLAPQGEPMKPTSTAEVARDVTPAVPVTGAPAEVVAKRSPNLAAAGTIAPTATVATAPAATVATAPAATVATAPAASDDTAAKTEDALPVTSILRLARTSLQAGDLSRARQRFRLTLAKDPSNVEAMAGLGDVARHEGDLVEARQRYRDALEKSPAYAPAVLALADVSWDLGDRAFARKHYIALVDRHGERAPAHALERGAPNPHPH